jgi:hypothetical protein
MEMTNIHEVRFSLLKRSEILYHVYLFLGMRIYSDVEQCSSWKKEGKRRKFIQRSSSSGKQTQRRIFFTGHVSSYLR